MSEWIKTSERLPPDGRYVLACWMHATKIASCKERTWVCEDRIGTMPPPPFWQPLPAVPESLKFASPEPEPRLRVKGEEMSEWINTTDNTPSTCADVLAIMNPGGPITAGAMRVVHCHGNKWHDRMDVIIDRPFYWQPLPKPPPPPEPEPGFEIGDWVMAITHGCDQYWTWGQLTGVSPSSSVVYINRVGVPWTHVHHCPPRPTNERLAEWGKRIVRLDRPKHGDQWCGSTYPNILCTRKETTSAYHGYRWILEDVVPERKRPRIMSEDDLKEYLKERGYPTGDKLQDDLIAYEGSIAKWENREIQDGRDRENDCACCLRFRVRNRRTHNYTCGLCALHGDEKDCFDSDSSYGRTRRAIEDNDVLGFNKARDEILDTLKAAADKTRLEIQERDSKKKPPQDDRFEYVEIEWLEQGGWVRNQRFIHCLNYPAHRFVGFAFEDDLRELRNHPFFYRDRLQIGRTSASAAVKFHRTEEMLTAKWAVFEKEAP